MLMRVTEYARHRGCELQAVQFAIKRGRIQKDENGFIDSEKADRDWQLNSAQSAATANPAIDEICEPVPGMSFASARALRLVYDAQRKQLDLRVRIGELVERKLVEAEAYSLYRTLRDALLNLPPRLAAQLAAESDPAGVHELLETELVSVLENFSGGKLQ